MASSQLATSKVLQSLSEILITKDSEPPGQIIGAGLQSKQELLAITIHTVLVLAGFRLIGTGEQGTVASSSAEQPTELPSQWNTESKDSWTFRYVRPDSQNTFLVKCISLFDNLLVTGTTLE
ncbi:hypothetical protein BDF22DRAFT_208149 [Syncephalis plumigaleata]|nr:hypothetical protein BDF22DRAFT_208149 [Syncephalis plumigaleata]